MKFDRKAIMIRAWEIKRMDESNIFGLCLKMAWVEVKSQSAETPVEVEKVETLDGLIARLEKAGWKRWQKKGYDRMYVNASTLGLVCNYYNTGNICSAFFQGAGISNCQARKMKGSKTFLDLKTMKVYSDNWTLGEAAAEIAKVEFAK